MKKKWRPQKMGSAGGRYRMEEKGCQQVEKAEEAWTSKMQYMLRAERSD